MSIALTDAVYHRELIDGREIQKPLPKNLHAFIQTYLLQWFGRELPKQYRVASELNVICGSDRLVPDVILTTRNAHYVDGDLVDPPLLAVEIMSPGQTLSDLLNKCERMLATGTPICWVIWPERREAWTYTRDEALREATRILSVALPNSASGSEVEYLRIPLAEMWAELSE